MVFIVISNPHSMNFDFNASTKIDLVHDAISYSNSDNFIFEP